jgi:hypothetical protein
VNQGRSRSHATAACPSAASARALLTGFVGTYAVIETVQERAGTDQGPDTAAQTAYLRRAAAAFGLPRLVRQLDAPDPGPPPTFESLLDRMIEGLLG